MANALGALFSDIADSIREKTGETGSMKPAEFPAAIDGISVGADTEEIDDILDEINGEFIAEAEHKFTFIGVDGEVLCEVTVYDTQDCPDPIAENIISKPTKESTAQYSYTFSHWSPIEGGSADDSIFKKVTEDRTVYAVFAPVLRNYTIRYYDGETLKKSVTYSYGTAPTAYILEKQGYSFEGWVPVVTTVTENVDCYAQWSEKPSFAGSSWADISAISASGKAAETFYLGDRKTIVLSNADGSKTETMEVEICNFDDDGRMTIGSVDVVQVMFGKVPVEPLQKKYTDLVFYKNYASLLVSYMPIDLKNVLIEHTRLSINRNTEKQEETLGKVFIPSRTELDGSYDTSTGFYDGKKFGHYTHDKSRNYFLRYWKNYYTATYNVESDRIEVTGSTDYAHIAFIFKV